MTISSTTNRKSYSGDGTTVTFAFPYYFLVDGDLKVYSDDVLQTITTDYTVSGAGDTAGGSITYNTAPASSVRVDIIRDPPITQTTDWVENDPDSAAVKEMAFDKLTMICQRLSDRVDRVVSLSEGVEDLELTLPLAADGYVLGWSVVSGETALVNLSPGEAYIPVQATEPDAETYKLWYDSDNEALKYWDGAAWQEPGSIDISGKQNRDTDAVTGNVAMFDASGHTVDAGAPASILTGTLLPLQRGTLTDYTTDSTNNPSIWASLSSDLEVTPTEANTKLEGVLYIHYAIQSATTSTVLVSLSAGYRNSSGITVETGVEYTPRIYAKSTTAADFIGVATIPIELSSSQVNASGDWAVIVRGISSETADYLYVYDVEFKYEEYRE